MAEPDDVGEKRNAVFVDSTGRRSRQEEPTLPGVLRRLLADIFFPDPSIRHGTAVQRIKGSLSTNVPLLREASRSTGSRILLWTRRGSPLRALLVVSDAQRSAFSVAIIVAFWTSLLENSIKWPTAIINVSINNYYVGTIALLDLTGLIVFMLFFLTATINAAVISLLVSLAAAGGCLALFFACVTVIYIGALSVAAFVISTATISAIIAALVATGWIGFFWTLWLGTKKSVGFAKRSLTMTGSAISAYSSARRARHHHHHHHPDKVSD